MDTTPSSNRHTVSTSPADGVAAPGPGERALVLAGAGAAGNAWEIGLIAGLADAGVDLTAVELVIGTSAGSTVAAQVTSGTRPADLYAAILGEVHRPPGAEGRPSGGRRTPPGPAYLEWSNGIIGSAVDASDMRRRMGAAALEREAADGSGTTRWRDTVAARLPDHRWPRQRVLITAVDARTGEPVVFDRDSGVDLVDAVAASTSNGFAGPYRIGAGRYINGGYRRNENADLAAGYGRVVVLSPFGGRSRHPPAWGMQLAAQVEELRAGGSRVETVVPDGRAEHLFGANAMDLSLRPPAARAGRDQGRALAADLAGLWR